MGEGWDDEPPSAQEWFMHTLLVGPFAEAEKAEINISDVDPPVFRELLPKLDLTPS